MKILINLHGSKGHGKKPLIFMLVIAVFLIGFVSVSNSAVYGDAGDVSTGGGVTVSVWTVKFLDIDGSVLKTQEVEDGQDATPPAINTKEGYKFLGWDNWYINVTEDRTVRAVYELVMTTSETQDGQLASAGTAKPPAPPEPTGEALAVATEGGMEIINTSDDAITTPEIIKTPPTPTTTVEEKKDESMSPTQMILIALAVVILMGIAGGFIFMYLRKKRREEYTS